VLGGRKWPLYWADVDFRWGSLWVKDKVVEEGRKIPLTPYVSSLLAALPRPNDWVFSSPTAKAGRIAVLPNQRNFPNPSVDAPINVSVESYQP
jgi:hypothetical protein